MSGVTTASELSWTAPFAGLSPCQFRKLVTALRHEGADPVRKRQKRLSGIDEMVISLAVKGLTTGEVQVHLAEVYRC